jgi:putative transposase
MDQIVAILKQTEVGIPVAELIRQTGSRSRRSIAGRRQYVWLEVDQVRQLRQVNK